MEKQNGLKAVLFDFDGTLAFLPTNYDRMRKRLRSLFSGYGIDSDFQPLMDSIKYALCELQKGDWPWLDVAQIKQRAMGIVEDEEIKAVANAQLVNHAKETLAWLMTNGIQVAIVSRNGRACIEGCFSKFGLADPDAVIARESTRELKPHPDHFAAALGKLGVEKHEAVIVGDTHHDIEGGNNFGIRTVLVSARSNNGSNGTIEPGFTVDNLCQIPWESLMTAHVMDANSEGLATANSI